MRESGADLLQADPPVVIWALCAHVREALTIDADSCQSITWYSTAWTAAWVRFEAPSFLMQALT